MRTPDFHRDGWALEDGKAYSRDVPETFHVPSLEARKGLRPGDFAKLIFRISVDNDAHPEAVERMWVIVREVLPGGTYIGVLDNDPTEIDENPDFWAGAELPFEARHVIAIQEGDDASCSAAASPPSMPWRRD